jgi:hypothetical protein
MITVKKEIYVREPFFLNLIIDSSERSHIRVMERDGTRSPDTRTWYSFNPLKPKSLIRALRKGIKNVNRRQQKFCVMQENAHAALALADELFKDLQGEQICGTD